MLKNNKLFSIFGFYRVLLLHKVYSATSFPNRLMSYKSSK